MSSDQSSIRYLAVGVDGSRGCERAVDWAMAEARRRGWAVRLVHAVPRLHPADPEPLLHDQRARVDRVLSRARQVAGRYADVATTIERAETFGVDPGSALVEASRQAECLVVGRVGEGWAANPLAGSVTRHVARHAACPVAVIGGIAREPSARIVVGWDGSDDAERALGFALARAERTHDSVTAIRAWSSAHLEHPSPVLRLPPGGRQPYESEAMEVDIAPWREKFGSVELVAEAIEGDAPRVLRSASSDADLLVVGARGRSAAGTITGFGSTSRDLLRHAQCPIVIAR